MPGAADDALRLSPATTSSSGSRSGSRNILRRRVIIIINSNALGAKGINILPDHPTPKGGTIGADGSDTALVLEARSPTSADASAGTSARSSAGGSKKPSAGP
eukprot:CAMPEP_0197732862 /NCGR_PEP_ID=MMETSP1434-20131217/42065_1 /TAXON_ID=265543 /ORGANISM="Minutocellus polymorphus, Strain CCMP3303" /LENGTH=102 /DNA_ID=CAMNT_0043320145 /DNA_START=191 /DNA_END=497 /DNA_ORIENTATION=+